MSLINTLEHAFAKAAQDIVTAAKFVSGTIVPALKKAQASETVIEAVTGTVSKEAVNVERSAFAILGVVVKAIEDAGAAGAAGGLSVTLDAALVADLKTIIPAIKGAAVPPTN